MRPLCASSPEGTSIASTGAPQPLMRAIASANGGSTSRRRPMPRRPSTTSAGRDASGHSPATEPPRATKRSRAARASAAFGGLPERSSTTTRWKVSARRAAATHASPPLLPGPATTRISSPVSRARSSAQAATAAPARSMSEADPACAARASTARSSSTVRTGARVTVVCDRLVPRPRRDRAPCRARPGGSAENRG